MKHFIQWLVIFSLIILGLFIMTYSGIMARINEADFTKISFVIIALFLLQSFRIGIDLFRGGIIEEKLINSAYFFAESFTKLGFIGTIAGFIYALYHTFTGINIADMASTQTALIAMATGIGTALYTTITGLVCSLLIRIQLYNYEKDR